MKRTAHLIFAAGLLCSLVSSVGATSPKRSDLRLRDSMIVSVEWLQRHINDKQLVLLQVGEKAEFEAGHIPGAQFVSLDQVSTPRGQGLTLELPPAAQLVTTFEKLGISDSSQIVLYFSKDWVTPTARIFFTLDYLGLGDRTSILDGGLPEWRLKGPVTTEVIEPKPGKISTRPNPKLVVDANWVSANLNKPGVIILDARARQFYTGEQVGRMPRGGHIPGARNIPFSNLVDETTNRFKDATTLRSLFETAGVKRDDSVTTYCHIGQQASLLYFVARYLGYDAHVYDGSFEDWSRRTELPVEK